MKATWNVSTQSLAKMPYWVKPLVASPHELSCASKRYLDYLHVAPEEEETHIDEAIETLQRLTGDKTLPRGWNIDRPSNISRLLYARTHKSRGLPQPYTSDDISDELPFWVPSPLLVDGVKDDGLLVVPMTHDTSDRRFLDNGSGWVGLSLLLTHDYIGAKPWLTRSSFSLSPLPPPPHFRFLVAGKPERLLRVPLRHLRPSLFRGRRRNAKAHDGPAAPSHCRSRRAPLLARRVPQARSSKWQRGLGREAR